MSNNPSLFLFETSNNRLTFEDLEPNIGITLFGYANQAKVGEEENYFVNDGDNVDLFVEVGGTANTYQWYNDDVAISGANNDNYSIINYNSATDEGIYTCQINNSIVTDLTLMCENKYVGNSMAVNNKEKLVLKVYPNPASGILNIETIANTESKIEITNICGITVCKNSNITSTNFKIDVADYSPGVYFVKMQSGNKVLTTKLLINN